MATRSAQTEVAYLRASAQRLMASDTTSPAAVAQHLLAIQAQDLVAAKWAVGRRAVGISAAQVDDALNDGSIVRSWPMRGTLHFVPPADLGWMQQLTTARLLQQAVTRHAGLGLDRALLERARESAHDALSGGRALTRDAFQQTLEAHGISTSSGRGYHVIWYLAQTGTLCWGPTTANAQSLVLVDEWIQHPRHLEHDEALAEFVIRYMRGHGPATLKDFVWWSKLTVAEAKRGLAAAGAALIARQLGDETYWLPAENDEVVPDAAAWRRFSASVALLPAFDEYFLGYRDRELAADSEHHEVIVPGKNGIFQPIVVAGGRVQATWKRVFVGAASKRRRIAIELAAFGALSATQRAGLQREAERYAQFLGCELGEVTVRDPH